MSKVLLREYYELCEGGLCQDFLTESEKNEVAEGKAMYLTGVIQRAKAKNQNGRIYPRAILERELMNYQKFIQKQKFLVRIYVQKHLKSQKSI